MQAKFLRVLEGHPFERIGGSKPIKVDVRVIAATNRDLERDVAEGRFRRDLYFRLRVLEIVVPALRKRPEDIPMLADYFLQKFNAETGRKIRGFTKRPGAIAQVPLAGQRPRVEERHRAGGGALPRPGDRRRRPVADEARHGRRHRSRRPDRRQVSCPSRWTTWSAATSSPRSITPVGTRAGRPASSGIERSTLDRKIHRYQLDAVPPPRSPARAKDVAAGRLLARTEFSDP